MESRLYIQGLGPGTTKNDIKRHFTDYKDITDIFIPINKKSNNNRGFGFIGFRNQNSACRAIDDLNQTYIGRHIIQLSFSEAKEVTKQTHELEEVNTLIIKNISTKISYEEIYALFSHIGPISNIDLRKIKSFKHPTDNLNGNNVKATISFQNIYPLPK